MESLNDLIWNDEDSEELELQSYGMAAKFCMVTFSCGDYSCGGGPSTIKGGIAAVCGPPLLSIGVCG